MLRSMRIGSYRSYYEPCEIEFAIPKENGIGLTIIVGRNNSGKSTILKTLVSAFDEKPNIAFDKLDRHDDSPPTLEIKFAVQDLAQTLTLERPAFGYFDKIVRLDHDGQVVRFNSIFREDMPFLGYVPSRRPWADTFNPQNISPSVRQFEMQAAALRQHGQMDNLGDQLNSIIQKDTKADFDALLKEVLPDLSDWSTDLIAGQSKIVYRTANGKEHAISDVGDGVVSIFRICFALLSHENWVPLILDEPELSLHPEAQKKLYALISRISRQRQIILATHSPHFVHWPDLSQGAKVYRVFQTANGKGRISTATKETTSSIFSIAQKDKKNRKLFDYAAKEIFFQDRIFICEGQEDAHIIGAYIEESALPSLPIFAYGAGGASNVLTWTRLAAELGIRCVALYDRDAKNVYDVAESEFGLNSNVLNIITSMDDIRDKANSTGAMIKTGYFDGTWSIKADLKHEFDSILKKAAEFLNGKAVDTGASDPRTSKIVPIGNWSAVRD